MFGNENVGRRTTDDTNEKGRTSTTLRASGRTTPTNSNGIYRLCAAARLLHNADVQSAASLCRRADSGFLEQDYLNRELIVLDDGSDAIPRFDTN